MEKKLSIELNSMWLHIFAIIFMFCDHLWATLISGNEWMTCIGRLAFPIFAFMIVEGYFHTKSLKKYVLRLLVCAVISEIPFNIVMGSSIIYPFHQNVIWTFLIGILCIFLNEKARKTNKMVIRIFTGLGTVILGSIMGLIFFVDYFHAGVLTILVFYFFRGRKWWCFLGQLVGLYYINMELLSGLSYEIVLFGQTFFFPQQGFALFALILIWLYRGKQGPYNSYFKFIYYGFYPIHLLILGLLSKL